MARRQRKTVGSAPNTALKPSTDTLKVGDGTAAQPPAPAKPPAPRTRRPPFGSYLDTDLQRQFKAACVLRGIEMQDGLEEAIRMWLAKHGPASQ
ncbi:MULTISPECIES: hypothetical protein [Streptomyces]|uniref:ParG n=1 Tax=Streptomyces demainii TaxID=588122 RepID=A0ABT9L9I5_9ACTN|nr:hypothetical protein [Streptomyces demainii]MDP9616432.1 hypothetical protein [Streptomyces demainii]